jgi:phage gp37-like protein
VEDAIVARAQAALGVPAEPKVRVIETLPGQWTLEALRRALQTAPGVYVGFLGGAAGADGSYINARFGVYVVAKGAIERARRRGTQVQIGAYEIIALLARALDRLEVAGVGEAKVTSVDNLFREALFEAGGSVYGLTLELANMPWPAPDVSALAPFVTYHAEHSMAAGEDEPDAIDEVTLPQ